MAKKDNSNLAEKSGHLVESHTSYDPRITLFHVILAMLLLTLAGGLGYQQLFKTSEYNDRERQQNQRRVLFPGPRGNIYDRNGKTLVSNSHRFTVILHLDELKDELRREQIRIQRNFVNAGEKKNTLSLSQLRQISRVSLVQKYLDQVNGIIGRNDKVRDDALMRHFDRQLLLPYTLIDNLDPTEYARLIERLPVRSPLEVYATNVRNYHYGSAAAHTLGYVRPETDIDADGFPGEGLTTFKMRGTSGRDGLERSFDSVLQGEAGGRIYRVDPTGFKINPPLEVRAPKQGRHLMTSLDIDLQLAGEAAVAETEMAGAGVAIDVRTGEVLALVSKPDYDLNDFSPRISTATWADAVERQALFPRAVMGAYPPGSTFKILTAIAGLRSGVITPDTIANCAGRHMVGNRWFPCHAGHVHGDIGLETAVAKSCNIYFYKQALEMGPEALANEGRRFRLDSPTGIELPGETRRMIIPDPEWKRRERASEGPWSGGDTANTSIGQGFVLVSPLQMACFTASVARGEVWTQPTLIHDANRPRQRTESIGLTPAQQRSLIDGMEQVTLTGTAAAVFGNRAVLAPLGIRVAAKTGTAQVRTENGTLNIAWMIAFAPVEDPQIAIAVAIEGDVPGEETGGGRYAGPVVHAMLKAWVEKKNQRTAVPFRFKAE